LSFYLKLEAEFSQIWCGFTECLSVVCECILFHSVQHIYCMWWRVNLYYWHALHDILNCLMLFYRLFIRVNRFHRNVHKGFYCWDDDVYWCCYLLRWFSVSSERNLTVNFTTFTDRTLCSVERRCEMIVLVLTERTLVLCFIIKFFLLLSFQNETSLTSLTTWLVLPSRRWTHHI